jgi:hypothetical protein
MNTKLEAAPVPQHELATSQIEEAESREHGEIKIDRTILERAKKNDLEALESMFRKFIPVDEKIVAAHYLGVEGLWKFGSLSFACTTNRRVASIRTGIFNEVIYQDGCMEYINSTVIYQPSLLWLYLTVILVLLVPVVVLGGIAAFLRASFGWGFWWLIPGVILLPWFIKAYYRLNKCGLVVIIREGVSVYMFTDRRRLKLANRMYRAIMGIREARIREIGFGV